MGRRRVWKAKDPSFRRLLGEVAAEGDRYRAKGRGWRVDGLWDWPLPRVLWRLAELGLPCTKAESFEEAFAVASEYGLASLWALRLGAQGELREFLEYAADVVCNQWHFRNGGGPEAAFVLAADLAIEDECREERGGAERLRKCAEAALQAVKVASVARPDDPAAWIAMMEARTGVPVSAWAADLVIALGAADLYEDGIAVAEAWAPVALTERFRAELPFLLALAGREDDARRQVEALRRDYPHSLSALFMAGEALVVLGEKREGYEIVERAMSLAESREERLWIRDHLAGLAAMIEAERKEEPAPVSDDEVPAEILDVPEPLVAKERVGRNDPCPCGSGRKYKKCCAR